MRHYDPAKDPKVMNGRQEAYGLKVGDKVSFTNDNGVIFNHHTVVGFIPEKDLPLHIPGRTVYIDSDSPWFPVRPESLKRKE